MIRCANAACGEITDPETVDYRSGVPLCKPCGKAEDDQARESRGLPESGVVFTYDYEVARRGSVRPPYIAGEKCAAEGPRLQRCLRLADHPGQHVAWGTTLVTAVWLDSLVIPEPRDHPHERNEP